MPPVRVLVIGGRDRLRYLQALVAQDLAGLAPGDGVHGALTDDRGRPISDFHLYVLPEAVLLELPEGRAEETRAALESRIIADDVRTAWATGEVVAYEGEATRVACVIGHARSDTDGRMSAISAVTRGDHPRVSYTTAGGREAEDPLLEEEVILAAVPAARESILCASRLGEAGALHWVRGDRSELLAALARGGAVVPRSQAELDPLEITAGRISTSELAEAKVWNELGVMAAVSLSKGCWMGQEIVRRVHVLGETKRTLRGVELDVPDGNGWAGAVLEDAAGSAAGTVTRAAYVAFLGATMGLAFVRRDAAPGTTLTAVDSEGKRISATVRALPLVTRQLTGAPPPAWIPVETA